MRNLRKLLFLITRVVLGVGLAVGLIYLTLRSTETDLWSALMGSQKTVLAVALLLFGVLLLLGTWRWNQLLRMQGIHLKFRDAWRLTMIGHFFNLAVPGAVGGDIFKMGFISRQAQGKGTEAVFSIVADRVLGMLGLFIVASAAVLFSLGFLLSIGQENRAIQVAAFTVGLGSAAGLVGVLAVRFHQQLLSLPWLRKLFNFLESKVPQRLTDIAVRMVRTLEVYRQNGKAVAQVVALAIAMHSLQAVNLYLVGKSLHESTLSLGNYFLAAQVANAVAAIPVTPAGVGTRDFITKSFFEQLGMSADKVGAIPVTLTIIIIFWGLVGAAVFIVWPVPHSTPPDEDR